MYTVEAMADTECTYITKKTLRSMELMYPNFDEQIYQMTIKRAERFGSTVRRVKVASHPACAPPCLLACLAAAPACLACQSLLTSAAPHSRRKVMAHW